jgi:demethylmenaquinone methyltransferase/2-methoxy-6-polyprenyl-1,4-benzoquinol methylase
MIEAVASREHARRYYDGLSGLYSRWWVHLHRRPCLRALARAALGPQDHVLEVATGPGLTLLEIVKRLAPRNAARAIDLSFGMLKEARHRVEAAGYTNIDLGQADARRLPFPTGTFDLLYNSFLLDLIPLDDIGVVLGEFHRVLRPGGRLVLVDLSKPDEGHWSWWETVYQSLPRKWSAYIFGGCRPVLAEPAVRQAGFSDVEREFVRHIIPSEIITAKKLDS